MEVTARASSATSERCDSSPSTSTTITSSSSSSSSSVQVAVRVRPLSESEVARSNKSCVHAHGATRVVLGDKQFDFDAAFAPNASQQHVYEQLVAPLVDRFFDGYNATVLAYGQTGSGKTFTMGNDFKLGAAPDDRGIIPRTMDTIFARVQAAPPTQHIIVKVSYLEILNEEIYDLLAGAPGATAAASTAPGLSVRDEGKRGIVVAGLREHCVASLAQVASLLQTGALQRATAATTMNAHSSRSHAICTLTMEQLDATGTRVSKFHLVDLAGSERAKRTHAHGARFREGVNINRGLLALGNVINALSDRSRVSSSFPSASSAVTPASSTTHVPYRDSKLTRLLQDSLGGNSKTVMVACVSPADVNSEETANTLRYAARARRIENTAVVNNEVSEVAALRQQVLALQARGSASSTLASTSDVAALERELAAWKDVARVRDDELRAVRSASEQWKRVADHVLRAQPDDSDTNDAVVVLRTATALAREALAFHSETSAASRAETLLLPLPLPPPATQQLRADLASLSDVIVEKEKIVQSLAAQPSASAAEAHLANLSASYERSVRELEHRVAALAAEQQHQSEPLGDDASGGASSSDGDGDRDAATRESGLNRVHAQLSALQSQLEVAQRAASACRELSALGRTGAIPIAALERELVDLRKQRAALQRRLRDECEAHRRDKRAHERQILQLQRQDQRQQLELQRLVALHAKQHNVLKRKTEEVALANKRMRTMATPSKRSAPPPLPLADSQAATRRDAATAVAARVLQCALNVQRMAADAKRALEHSSLETQRDTSDAAAALRHELTQAERISALFPDDSLPTHVSACHDVIRALLDAAVTTNESSSSASDAGGANDQRTLETHRDALQRGVAAIECEVRALVALEGCDVPRGAVREAATTMTASRHRELQHELATAKHEIATLRHELAVTQRAATTKPKPKPKRKPAAAEDLDDSIVSSSMSDESDEIDDDDSDYEDIGDAGRRRTASRKPRVAPAGSSSNNNSHRLSSATSLLATSGSSGGDLMDEIDDLLALPSRAGVPLCCTCAGKCATRACACKEVKHACGTECACSVARCLNRDGAAAAGNNKSKSQQQVSSSGGTTKANELASFVYVGDGKENSAPVPMAPVTPLSKLQQLWPRAAAAAAAEQTPKTPRRLTTTERSATTPKSLIKPPSRRFVLQSITASAQKQMAALAARYSNSSHSSTGSSSAVADRIDRFL